MSAAATCWEEAYRAQVEAIKELRADNAELRAKLDDPARLHAHCVRYLTDAQVAHLFGERMTEIVNSRDKLERENAALRGALALGQENCDSAYDDLRQERDLARIELAAFKRNNLELIGRINTAEAENAALRERLHVADSEIDQWAARCAAAIWMLPEAVTGGELREAQDRFHRMLHAARKEAQP